MLTTEQAAAALNISGRQLQRLRAATDAAPAKQAPGWVRDSDNT